MITLSHRARGHVAAITVACGTLLLGACDLNQQLLAPQQPGVISPAAINSATAADALYTGALGQWKAAMNGGGVNIEGLWNEEALFTDEDRSVDTFVQRQNADQRNLQTNDADLTTIYDNAQQARGRARVAINGLLQYDPSATGKRDTGEMYFMMGYLEIEMSEVFCNGIPFGETVNGVPQYTQPLTSAAGLALGSSRIDTALTYLTGTDAGTINIKDAALVTQARAQLDLGNFTAAAALVANVPTSFQYTFDFSQTTFDNEWWDMGADVKRYSAGDSTDIAGQIINAIPFWRLNDPRVSATDTKTKAEDNISDFVQVNNWNRDDPVPPVNGIDAQLIVAESDLHAGNIAGMMTILNALRASAQTIGIFKIAAMPALATPPDQTTATNLFFREKALWQFQRGWRMGDLRRLVRQYGRSQANVYPSGNFTALGAPAGQYGSQVVFPVPDVERTNPYFTGCLDTNA